MSQKSPLIKLPQENGLIEPRLSDVHMIHTLKQKSQEERGQIFHDALGKELVLNIPEGQANAMKATWG